MENLFNEKNLFNLTDEFKNGCLYYLLKNEKILGKMLVTTKLKNLDFYDFIQNKNNHKFNNILNFYEKNFESYLDPRGFKGKDFMEISSEIFLKNIKKILEKGFLDKKDFGEISDAKFLNIKYLFFLDFLQDEERIFITIECFTTFIKFTEDFNGGLNFYEILDNRDQLLFIQFDFIKNLFLQQKPLSRSLSKKIGEIFKGIYGEKLLKGEIFYLTLYNKFFVKNCKNSEEKIKLLKESFDKINNSCIEKKYKNNFKILNLDNLIANKFFHYLLLNNVAYIFDSRSGFEVSFSGDFYFEFIDEGVTKLKEVENVDGLILINGNQSEIFMQSFQKKIASIFILGGGEVNKKNIKYSKKDLQKSSSLKPFIENGITGLCKNLFENSDYAQYSSEIFMQPLRISSKRFVTSNMCDGISGIKFEDIFKDVFEKCLKDLGGKWIDINGLSELIFEDYYNVYYNFQKIGSIIHKGIGHKLEGHMNEFIYSEKQLMKRFFVFLAELGYCKIAGEFENKRIEYYSSAGFGWNSGWRNNISDEKIFDAKYIKFEKIDFNATISDENHISGNDIYLSLKNEEYVFEEFSKFASLEKIENFAVLNITRDSLINGKNKENITSEQIFKLFDYVNLEIPKHLEILIKSIENQKTDLEILPVGIPVILENIGTFKELLKLKKFSDKILFSNENLKLIIFNESFRTLEKNLTAKNILFEKKRVEF